MKFKVSYIEQSSHEIVVEATSLEEAEEMVIIGNCDYGDSFETDAYVVEITDCKKWVG